MKNEELMSGICRRFFTRPKVVCTFFILHSSFFIFFACTAPMDIRVRAQDSRIVVYSTLMGGAPAIQQVTVQRTVPYFSKQIDGWIDNARVTISTSEGGTFETVWVEQDKMYLTKDFFGTEPGVTYTLTVECDSDGDGTPEVYTASTTPQEPPRFDSIKVEPFTMPMTGNLNYRLSLFGTDSPGEDFYIIRVAVNDVTGNSQLDSWTAMDDRLFDGGSLDGLPLGMYASNPDPFGTGDTMNMWLAPGDRVGVLISRVDRDFFEFVLETQNSGGMTNPFFGGPPYNMRTNMQGGAIGYFGSLYSAILETVVPAE